jgi:hypothetical protein
MLLSTQTVKSLDRETFITVVKLIEKLPIGILWKKLQVRRSWKITHRLLLQREKQHVSSMKTYRLLVNVHGLG